jgi:cytochrome P450 family 4
LYNFFFKKGLLTDGGEFHKQQKKSLNPLFSLSTLKDRIPKINQRFKHFMDENNQRMEDKPFAVKDIFLKFTLNTVLWTMFGIEDQVVPDEELNILVDESDEYLRLSCKRMLNILMYPESIFKLTKGHKRRYQILERQWNILKKYSSESNMKELIKPSFFDCMKPHSMKMTEEELMESTVMFLGATTNNTASAISATLFLLAANPDKQEKLFDEISSILTSWEDEVTENMLDEMKYLDLVIKESLRLIPSVIVVARVATDNVEFSKCKEIK